MSIQVSKRRIQRLGGSSLIVTLPKPWIRKYGLKPGDEVLVIDEGSHLRILPSRDNMEEMIRTLTLRKTQGYIDLQSAVLCAFTRGYDKIEIPVTKSNIERVAAELTEVESLDIIVGTKLTYSKAVISLVEGGASPQTVLRSVRKTLIDLIDALESGSGLGEVELRQYETALEYAVRELQRIMSKKGVSACEEAPLDPYGVGLFHGFIELFVASARELANVPLEDRRKLLEPLTLAVISGMGGMLNGSVKRTRDALRSLEELRRRVAELREKYPGLAVLDALSKIFEKMLHDVLCNVLDKQEKQKR